MTTYIIKNGKVVMYCDECGKRYKREKMAVQMGRIFKCINGCGRLRPLKDTD